MRVYILFCLILISGCSVSVHSTNTEARGMACDNGFNTGQTSKPAIFNTNGAIIIWESLGVTNYYLVPRGVTCQSIKLE